jgi:hypothetical protein
MTQKFCAPELLPGRLVRYGSQNGILRYGVMVKYQYGSVCHRLGPFSPFARTRQ